MVSVEIPTRAAGPTAISFSPGRTSYILGQNGSGKSALVQRIFTHIGNAVYLPGSRPSHFESESLNLNPEARRQLISNMRGWDSQPSGRWRVLNGNSRNEKAIYDLQVAESQYKVDAANSIAKTRGDPTAVVNRLRTEESPLDRINAILAQANLPITLLIHNAELMAGRTSGGTAYSVAKMSDGERSALILAAEVLSAPPESVFIVDEPEVHIHRSIAVPLLQAIVAERKDCTFIISTHELDLASNAQDAQAILVRGCEWQGDAVQSWDIDVINDTRAIPEWLRQFVVGSRRAVLFIEGETSSLDQPIYGLLFPNTSIRSRGSCRDVRSAVKGLRATEEHHRVSAFGLVDMDGMPPEEVAKHESEGVFPISVNSVEGLYFSPEVLRAVADAQSETLASPGLLDQAINMARDCLRTENLEYLASFVSDKKLRDNMQKHIPSRAEQMHAGGSPEITLKIRNDFDAEVAAIRELAASGDVGAIISNYPVKKSKILLVIARALRFQDTGDYERAALNQIRRKPELQEQLRRKLGKAAQYLNQ